MNAPQLVEVADEHTRPSEVAVVREMTAIQAEELLDWIENQGGTNLQVCRDSKGFSVQCVWPPKHPLAYAARSSKARELMITAAAV
jgi:hypothetical protein